MIVECNDVPEVVRVLRWMVNEDPDHQLRVLLKGSGQKGTDLFDCSVPAKQFMETVNPDSGRSEEW